MNRSIPPRAITAIFPSRLTESGLPLPGCERRHAGRRDRRRAATLRNRLRRVPGGRHHPRHRGRLRPHAQRDDFRPKGSEGGRSKDAVGLLDLPDEPDDGSGSLPAHVGEGRHVPEPPMVLPDADPDGPVEGEIGVVSRMVGPVNQRGPRVRSSGVPAVTRGAVFHERGPAGLGVGRKVGEDHRFALPLRRRFHKRPDDGDPEADDRDDGEGNLFVLVANLQGPPVFHPPSRFLNRQVARALESGVRRIAGRVLDPDASGGGP